MSYSRDEYTTAFEKTAAKHPSIRHSKAENVLNNADRLWSKYKPTGREFGQIIRLALNESTVWDESERKVYGSLIGYLFSARAQAVRRYRKAKIPKKSAPPKTPPPPAIIIGAKGQLAWEI